MELISSLRRQLDRLCADPEEDPNWMLLQLSTGLRERYGRVAVGFLRVGTRQALLLGLCDADGELVIKLPEDLETGPNHPTARAWEPQTEVWFDAGRLPKWSNHAAQQCFGETRSVFLTPWLVDRPSDWMIAVLSPIAAPRGQREDRSLSVSANLLATNLLRGLDAKRLARANAWIERELEEIAQLQRLLQPPADHKLAGVDVAFCSHFYQYAGGDYFDLPRLTHLIDESDRIDSADHWGVIVADVAGHGPSAAVEAAMLDAISRTYSGPVSRGPESITNYINRHLFTRRPRASFITAFIGNYWPADRTFSYVNAGHPAPLIRPRGGECIDLEVPPGIPLRIEPEYQWQREERRMEPEDILVMFTDGVTECRSPDNQELGREGLRQLVAEADGDARAISEHIKAGISRHRDGRPPQDDQTIIVIRFL